MSNKVIIAAAGSGKTTHLVNEALRLTGSKILITSYTDANTAEIRKKIFELHGCVPPHVTIIPWFSFMLQEGVRPYQGKFWKKRISHIVLVNGISAPWSKESDFQQHYLADNETIYSDKISKLACKINKYNKGKVIERLSQIYSHIFIDEIQDLAGYDLDFLNLLFHSSIHTLLVGDPRQGTYSTNNSQKNKQYSRAEIDTWFKEKANKGIITYDNSTLNVNYRCVPSICSFSNSIFPEYPSVESGNKLSTLHDGVFIIKSSDIAGYIEKYHPVLLRYDKRTVVPIKSRVINFGKSKGLTFERVLIFPPKSVTDWIIKNKALAESTKSKFYVATTRAQFSVGIVCDSNVKDFNYLKIYNSREDNNA